MGNDNTVIKASMLRVDIFTPSASYLIDGSVTDYGRTFLVSEDDEFEMQNYIEYTGKEYGFPVPRVYSTGRCIATKNGICTKDDVDNFFKKCAENNYYSEYTQTTGRRK